MVRSSKRVSHLPAFMLLPQCWLARLGVRFFAAISKTQNNNACQRYNLLYNNDLGNCAIAILERECVQTPMNKGSNL